MVQVVFMLLKRDVLTLTDVKILFIFKEKIKRLQQKVETAPKKLIQKL